MDIDPFIGEPRTLQSWLDACIKNHAPGCWLVFDGRIGTEEIGLTTQFFPVVGDAQALSDEAFEDFENSLIESGYR